VNDTAGRQNYVANLIGAGQRQEIQNNRGDKKKYINDGVEPSGVVFKTTQKENPESSWRRGALKLEENRLFFRLVGGAENGGVVSEGMGRDCLNRHNL